MKVYHGGYTRITEIDLSKGRSKLDFGQGFYVTSIRSQAEIWSARIGGIHKTGGVVSEFEFYENAFEHFDLKVLRFPGYTEEWLDFIILNRDPKTPVPAHDYDIVGGPIANDDVNDRINDYLAGVVSKPDFLKELIHHKPTHQICLCTVRSLQMIEPLDEKYYIDVKHISKPVIRALITEQNVSKDDAATAFYDSTVFGKLSDISTGLYLNPWQDIYEMLKKELDMT
jgi:hypothetical protein